jgi:hypothetical protein
MQGYADTPGWEQHAITLNTTTVGFLSRRFLLIIILNMINLNNKIKVFNIHSDRARASERG